MNSGFYRPSGFLGKEVWKWWIWVTLDKGQWMTLTSDIHKDSCTHLVDYSFSRPTLISQTTWANKIVCAPSIHPVWSESLLCTQWVAKDLGFLHAFSEDSDQADPSFRWVHMQFCWFFHKTAQMYFVLCHEAITMYVLQVSQPHLGFCSNP